VVLPVFNGEKYLEKAIASVLEQTHKNLELIVFDDGSTDQSLAISRSYEKTDDRVKVYTRENKGLVATLNEAIALADSDFIVRMDADDICYPERIELQLKRMLNNNLDIVGGAIDFLENDLITGKLTYREESDDIKASILTWGRDFCHPAVLVRKSVYKKYPYEEFPGIEDFLLWIRLALDPNLKLGNIEETVIKYRVHEQQVTQTGKDKNWHLDNQLKIMRVAVCGTIREISEDNLNAFEGLIRAKNRYMPLRQRELALGYIDKLFQSEKMPLPVMKFLLVIIYLRLKRKNRPKNKRWMAKELLSRLKFVGAEELMEAYDFKRNKVKRTDEK